MHERPYPDPLMESRESHYARCYRDGGRRPSPVLDLWQFADMGVMLERPLTRGWCVRGTVELDTGGARCQLTVGPAPEPHYQFQLAFPVNAMEELEAQLAHAAQRRHEVLERTGMGESAPCRRRRRDGWLFLGDAAHVEEIPLPGGWCLRLAVEQDGDGDRAVLSVGPDLDLHCAFSIPFLADSLDEVEALLRDLRHRRRREIERAMLSLHERLALEGCFD